MAHLQPRYANFLVAPLCGILLAGLIYLFYTPSVNVQDHNSSLRERVEQKLYDIRMRIAPSVGDTDKIAVVGIDEATIEAFDSNAANLSYHSLQTIIDSTLQTKAKNVVVLLPPQIFDYDDMTLDDLTSLAKEDPRLIIGVFDELGTDLGDKKLPVPLRMMRDQIASVDLTRFFRSQVIRDVEVNKFEGIPYIQAVLGKREIPNIFAKLPAPTEEDTTKIKIKYISPSDFHTVAAENLVRGPENAGLDGRTVFIGYTAYRKFTFNHREATRANTPWEVDGGELESGMPVVLIHAITFANLLNESWITTAPKIWNILQTVLVSLFSLWIWSLSAGFASFLFIGGWSLIIVIHSGSFAFFSFYVPLADTMLFSSVATISGALWRLRTEARVHAIQEAQMSSQRELAKMQERFLNRFSVQLAKINKNIKAALERQGQLKEGTGTIQQAYTKALGSCEELDDYLQGIQQFSSIDGSRQFQVRNQDFHLQPILSKVLAQFESRKKESQVVVKISGDESMRAHGDPTLTAQIVFNLISNAIKYSPPNSEIEIRFEHVGSSVKVTVSDSGPGIPEEFRDRIFEKFYRVKDDYVYKVKGHGLGLYLSRYFSELMNAKLSLAPSEKGAKFSLELKAATT